MIKTLTTPVLLALVLTLGVSPDTAAAGSSSRSAAARVGVSAPVAPAGVSCILMGDRKNRERPLVSSMG